MLRFGEHHEADVAYTLFLRHVQFGNRALLVRAAAAQHATAMTAIWSLHTLKSLPVMLPGGDAKLLLAALA